MKYYDIHTHILPNLDDGAASPELAKDMLECLKMQGVNDVALTPHYYSNKLSIEDFVKKRQESYETLKPLIPEGMNIILGSEVFVTKYLFNSRDLSPLCYQGTNYLLIEFPFDSSFGYIKSNIEKFSSNYNIIPVIAHIERYGALYDYDNLYELSLMGCLFQMNLKTLRKFSSRVKLARFNSVGIPNFVSTDCHSMGKRNPDYKKYIDYIEKKYGKKFVEELMDNASKIFSGIEKENLFREDKDENKESLEKEESIKSDLNSQKLNEESSEDNLDNENLEKEKLSKEDENKESLEKEESIKSDLNSEKLD